MVDRATILKAIKLVTSPAIESDEPGVAEAQQVWEDDNTVGGGYGLKISYGKLTNQPALMLFVKKKKASKKLGFTEAMPPALAIGATAVPTDVVETGPIEPQKNVTRKPL